MQILKSIVSTRYPRTQQRRGYLRFGGGRFRLDVAPADVLGNTIERAIASIHVKIWQS